MNREFDTVIGVDIGLLGGISFFDSYSGEVLGLYEMPVIKKIVNKKIKKFLDIDRLKFILEIPKIHNETAVVILESVHAFPDQGVVAMATLLEQKGIIRGMCKGLGYDELLVEPKTWQKHYGMVPPKDLKGSSASKTKTLRKNWLKKTSLVKARNLFPNWAESKLEPKTAHGLSDALLIGNWYLNTPHE